MSRRSRALRILAPGALATVQDGGRPGYAALGVGRSGAADPASMRLANRLLANAEDAAVIEITMGGLRARACGDLVVAVTGAPCPVTVELPDGKRRGGAPDSVLHVADGAELRLGTPPRGTRSYLAVRGGIDVRPVLGSRSTDTLAGVGPEPLVRGSRLPVGPAPMARPSLDWAPTPPLPAGEMRLRVTLGPRDDWFTAEAVGALLTHPYEVTAASDRIGMRLAGPELARAHERELPSEGMVPGALQVPPNGAPVLFLADHPVTGGYPVIAVVRAADLPWAAQARPGTRLWFVR